jgi:uncharacterized RDD family membrane protein YckC
VVNTGSSLPVPPNASQVFDFDPARLTGVLWRRIFGYAVDLIVIGCIVGLAWVALVPFLILSFGLLFGPAALLVALIPAAYHTLLIGGRRSATWGQRLFGVQIVRIDGGSPTYIQALIQTVIFYLTVAPTSGLILLIMPFNRYGRALHDFAAGTLALRRVAGPDILPPRTPGTRP